MIPRPIRLLDFIAFLSCATSIVIFAGTALAHLALKGHF